jgi:hypothetical protein
VQPTVVANRRRVRERDLQGHFTHGEADPGSDPGTDSGDDAAEGAESAEGSPGAGPPDVQLTRALEVLKSWTYFNSLRGEEAAAPGVPAGPVSTAASDDASSEEAGEEAAE